MNFIMSHPWLLAMILPTVLASIPSAIVKIEKMAIARLLSSGDEIDQEAIRATFQVWVVWAEKKGARDGPAKFAKVDSIVSRVFPFLSADQRKSLIEDAVTQMDAAAKSSITGK